MEAYRHWLNLFELYRYYSWIIDRFHISTQMWQASSPLITGPDQKGDGLVWSR
jgi:hypothetical protein